MKRLTSALVSHCLPFAAPPPAESERSFNMRMRKIFRESSVLVDVTPPPDMNPPVVEEATPSIEEASSDFEMGTSFDEEATPVPEDTSKNP